MKKSSLLIMLLTAGLLLALVGCNAKEEAASTPAAETAAEVMPEAAVEAVADSAGAMAATHDCAGGCGMTGMAADQTTEINGKFYCAGCAAKAAEEAPATEAGHEGHNHG